MSGRSEYFKELLKMHGSRAPTNIKVHHNSMNNTMKPSDINKEKENFKQENQMLQTQKYINIRKYIKKQ